MKDWTVTVGSSEEAERQEFDEQMQVATEAVQATVRRMHGGGEIHPQIIILAVYRYTEVRHRAEA